MIYVGVKFDYVNVNVIEIVMGKMLIKLYVIKEVGGVKIGFIGLVMKFILVKVLLLGIVGVCFLSVEEEVEVVNKYLKEL